MRDDIIYNMKILGIACSIIGVLVLSSKELVRYYLKLNEQLLYRSQAVYEADQIKISKYKLFEKFYDKYKLFFVGIVLSIVGALISFYR